MEIEVLEEKTIASLHYNWSKLQLIRDDSNIQPQYRIEHEYFKNEVRPMSLTFWEKVKWLFSKNNVYPMSSRCTISRTSIFEINDTDPRDPYAKNCAYEVWDYLTKNYTTSI